MTKAKKSRRRAENQPPAQPASAGKESPKPPPTRRSKLKLWGFRIGAVLFAVGLFALVEGLLVGLGVGPEVDLVVKVPGAPKALPYQVNPQAEKIYYAGNEVAGPEPRRFDLPRAEGVFRIVVAGASTVLGFPYPPEIAFPRQLEVLLNEQNSALRFEVINAGIVGINSFSVADIVQQSAALEPDLIIVHAGHNEFYGPAGVATTAVEPQSLYPFALKIRRLRLFQLMAGILPKKPRENKHLLERLPESIDVPLDGPQFRKAEYYYRKNLARMAAAARSAGIPILFTTVASNLSGHSPVSFLAPEDLDAENSRRWSEFFHRGEELSAKENWSQALEQFEKAQELSGDSSLLHYRRGQCLVSLEHYSEAKPAFERARDLDGCRFRAPASFQGIVRDVARECSSPELFFLDTADRIAEEAGPKPLGSDLFLEHVHYNLDGHRRLALILGRFVQETVLERTWDPARMPPDAKFDELLGLLPEDRISGLSYALQVFSVFPMTRTFDVNLHRGQIVAGIQQELDELGPEQQQVFADLSLDDMAIRLAEALGDHYEITGQRPRELFYRRADALRRPWDPEVRFRLARCLAETGDQEGALEECRRILELHPKHAGAAELLPTLMVKRSP
jgi:tetratricopeptide (TPR) repeat protein